MMQSPGGARVEAVVVPRTSDLGDFEVRRALPSASRRTLGPFVFLDAFGPMRLPPGKGMDVRPHPHIGLATVTYLMQGEILHRDSLGSVQPIQPGALNWMSAGRGIVHSERTPGELRAGGARLEGLQAWVALPRACEEGEPTFAHHAEGSLPVLDAAGARLRVVAGEWAGARSPAAVASPMFYVEARLDEGARLPFDATHEERGFYIVEGTIEVEGEEGRHEAGRLVVLRPGADVVLRAASAARVMLLGGEPLDGPRFVWWNFVSSSRERIEAAKDDWRAGRFAAVPGEHEFIPLPER